MKLTTTLFQPSRQYAATPTGDITGPARGEAGSDSEAWLADLYGGGPDVNPELTGSRKFRVFDEMAKTDPSVKGLLMYLGLSIRSAAWGLNPADEDDPVSVAIRDMVAWNLGLEGEDGQLDLSWDGQMAQALKSLQFGCMFEECVWDDARQWYDADGDAHLVRPLARLAPRWPVNLGKVTRRNGRIVRLEQQLPKTSAISGEWDAHKLVYLCPEPEGGHWEGVAVIRPAWLAWRLKKHLLVSAGIGFDRFAMGIPLVGHPDTPEGEERGSEIGRNMRGHERAYVRYPIPQGGTKEDAEWAIEILKAADSLADPTPLIRVCNSQIAEAGMQQFTELGETATGSRATAAVQIDPFFLAVSTMADYFRRERSRQVIRRIVEVNFGREAAEKQTPVLTVSKLQPRNVQVIAQAISYLKDAGFRFDYRAAYEDLCEMLGLPEPPEDFELQPVEGNGLPVDAAAAAVAAKAQADAAAALE